MSEIKPCPFCGSETVCAALLDIPYDPRRCYVLCQQCGARGPVFNGHEKVAVVEAAWNRRAAPEPAQGDWERARLYLSGFHVELYDGINRADIEPQKVIDSLAAEFARVREAATKKERERCERVAESLYGKTYWDDPVAGIAAAIRRGEP